MTPRALYWRKPRGETIWAGVRDGDWKYVGHRKGPQLREYLFNLADDPAVTQDLQQEEPQRFQQLKAKYQQWETDVRRHAR